MSDDRCGDWVKGLLIGGLVGVIVGMLYAPKSGRETRDELSDKAKDIVPEQLLAAATVPTLDTKALQKLMPPALVDACRKPSSIFVAKA